MQFSESFDYLLTDDAPTVLKKLRENGTSADSIFAISTGEEMAKKKILPYLGPWINRTINFEFQEKDPRSTFQQIINAEQHLKVSGLGCKQLKCRDSVEEVGRTYDDLIWEARDLR